MKRPAVLLVDNDAAFVSLMSAALSARYSVVTATDALEGYALACKRRFDLIVIGLRMPVLDGWTFIRKLRLNPARSEVPIIMVTDVEHELWEEEAQRLRVASVLSTTCTPREMTSAAGAVLQR